MPDSVDPLPSKPLLGPYAAAVRPDPPAPLPPRPPHRAQ
uniref:Uncharacterized protein n=1 Tax=Arundo donax TaxID=35708 RepID=A0A0A8ZE02_ARUDO